MKKSKLTAGRLRLLLSLALLGLVLAGIGIGYVGNQKLTAIAAEVNRKSTDAAASQNDLANLQKLQQKLQAHADTVKRASEVTVDSHHYNYQNQLVSDLTTYASKAGLTITSITFQIDTKPAPGTTAAPAAAAKTASVAIILKNPVDYPSLLNFYHYIEQNLNQMQIAKISITKDPTSGAINSDVINLQVYLR